MIAVFRHELESYFTSLTGFVFGAFLLLFAGIYTMVYNLSSGLANFEYVMGGISFVFLVIVPVLTMRVLAEERRQKTDRLLYSLPLSMTEVVLGKYAAMLVVFILPLLVIGIYPLILGVYGNVHFPAAFSAIIGFFFLGAALIAIGMYVSSVTESQAVSAGLCFVVMMINYFLADLAAFVSSSASSSFFAFALMIIAAVWVFYRMTRNGILTVLLALVCEAILLVCYVLDSTVFTGLFPELMERLSLFERFYVFLDGLFDVTGIVYFVTIAVVFLFMSVQSMEKRRWSE